MALVSSTARITFTPPTFPVWSGTQAGKQTVRVDNTKRDVVDFARLDQDSERPDDLRLIYEQVRDGRTTTPIHPQETSATIMGPVAILLRKLWETSNIPAVAEYADLLLLPFDSYGSTLYMFIKLRQDDREDSLMKCWSRQHSITKKRSAAEVIAKRISRAREAKERRLGIQKRRFEAMQAENAILRREKEEFQKEIQTKQDTHVCLMDLERMSRLQSDRKLKELELQHRELQTSHKNLQDDHNSLKDDHKNLKEHHETLEDSLNTVYHAVNRHKK